VWRADLCYRRVGLYMLLPSDGLEYGPVSETTMRQWLEEGELTGRFTDAFGSFFNGRVTVLVGDITKQRVDAIVNAANSTLLGGGGVDGAIHRAGGPQILDACREIRRTHFPRGLPTGEAVLTTAGNLPARHLIHTVGPVKGAWAERDAEMLALCYRNSMALAVRHHLRSIAFPAISTGIYGYPREEAAVVSSTAIAECLAQEVSIADVRLIFFTLGDAERFLSNHAFGG
jgi:O-acetyl-ADP-ribose deacetylase (regulator of RNase III)